MNTNHAVSSGDLNGVLMDRNVTAGSAKGGAGGLPARREFFAGTYPGADRGQVIR
jgi:hypothetical protein